MVFQRKVSKRLSKLRNKSKRSSRRNSRSSRRNLRSSRRNLRSSRRNLRSVTQRKNIRKIFGGAVPLGLGLGEEQKVSLAFTNKSVLVVQLSLKFKEMLVKPGDTVTLKQDFTAKKYTFSTHTSNPEIIEIKTDDILTVTQTEDEDGRVVTNDKGVEIVVPVTTLNESTFIDPVRNTKVTELCREIVDILTKEHSFDDIKNYLNGTPVDNPGDPEFFKMFTGLIIDKPLYKILLNRCEVEPQ